MNDSARGRAKSDTDCELMAHVAQLAEHVLGKDEVTRSIRVVGSIIVAVTRLGALLPLGGEHPIQCFEKTVFEKRSESWRRRNLSDESRT